MMLAKLTWQGKEVQGSEMKGKGGKGSERELNAVHF